MGLKNKKIDNLLQKIMAFPRPLLLGFDVDGTLAPIVSKPEQAKIPKKVIKALEKLNGQEGLKVAFLSGRDDKSLSSMMNMKPFWVAFQHGRFIKKANENFPEFVETKETTLRIDELTTKIQQRFAKLPLLLERKAGAVAVHTRALHALDADKSAWVLKEIKKDAEQMGLTARDGKMVCEVELYSQGEKLSDKGKALKEIVEQINARSVIFVGDDITDFPAIEFAENFSCGIGSFVNSNEMNLTDRKVSLIFDSTEEVQNLILALCEVVQEKK